VWVEVFTVGVVSVAVEGGPSFVAELWLGGFLPSVGGGGSSPSRGEHGGGVILTRRSGGF
jgi:hypothetical protein